eukprot:13310096-Heterocapsa_arctica.AAC.1
MREAFQRRRRVVKQAGIEDDAEEEARRHTALADDRLGHAQGQDIFQIMLGRSRVSDAELFTAGLEVRDDGGL